MEDTKVKENICSYLKEGLFKKDSAIMAGISEATLYRWLEEDESFKSRVEASILEYKRTLIKNMTVCAEKDGRLALEVLKRRFPKEWSESVSVAEVHEGYEKERKVVREWLQDVYAKERNSDINQA